MISMDKKYKTRGGVDVRLLSTDGPEPYSVIGVKEGDVRAMNWLGDGRLSPYHQTAADLIEVPNTVTKTFYRRKWCLDHTRNWLCTNCSFKLSKEEFDTEYDVGKDSYIWSDEWETITVEVPV